MTAIGSLGLPLNKHEEDYEKRTGFKINIHPYTMLYYKEVLNKDGSLRYGSLIDSDRKEWFHNDGEVII